MRTVPALLLLSLLTSCVASSVPQPRPAPARAEAPPRPASTALPLPTDWRDWPLTPGDWDYTARTAAGGSAAGFGISRSLTAELYCDRAARRIVLMAPHPGTATIRTSTLTRQLALHQAAGDPPTWPEASLSPADPLLDAIAFSRGRWTIEQPGQRPLVLPAWAEVARVVEDCRG